MFYVLKDALVFFSLFFKQELQKGISYCNIDDNLKKMSFVFVVDPKVNESFIIYRGKSFFKDSRECYVVEGTFTSSCEFDNYNFVGVDKLVPAYLIVLNCD